MDAVAIDRARPSIRQVAMPDFVSILGQHNPLYFALAGGIEEAEFDLCSIRREQSEVDAQAVPRGAERVG
jgi:hypothetical protein